MKKTKRDEMQPEYRRADLGKGVRGKFLKSYRKGHNLVLIRPEIAEVFPDEEAVNNALRGLIEIAQRTTEKNGIPGKRRKRATVGHGSHRQAR